MNRFLVKSMILSVIVILLFAFSTVTAGDKGKEVTIKGEVIDMSCYVSKGAKGEAHKACAEMCAKAGLPLGLLDEKGNVYLAASDKDMEPGNSKLMGHEAHTVTVKGTLFEKGGQKVIVIKSVEM